jgi:hypothetical protein
MLGFRIGNVDLTAERPYLFFHTPQPSLAPVMLEAIRLPATASGPDNYGFLQHKPDLQLG